MTTACPDRDQLRDYLNGQLNDEVSGPIVEHLQGCDECEDLASKLEGDSDWLLNHLSVAGLDSDDAPSPSWIPGVRAALMEDGEATATSHSEQQTTAHPIELGAYDIREVIGRGGMGIVYRALHRRLGKEVALKVVAARSTAGAVPRFEREMRAIGALNHPAIVQATDADSIDGRAFLVMELVDGVDLRALLREHGPLRPNDACAIIEAVAQGVQAAHDAGVIHRDLKPSNLMLNRLGQTKILDFGLAQLREDFAVASLSTSFGRLLGTLDYLAPEQAAGGTVDSRADVFGLGATLFALLAGRPAHGRSSEQPLISYLQQVATQNAPRLSDFRRDVPGELTELLATALARDPDQRFQTAAEFADRLKEFSSGSDLAALASEAISNHAAGTDDEDERRKEVAVSLADMGISHPNVPDRDHQRPATTGPRFLTWIWMALLLSCGLGLGGWLGIAIVLNTGEGELRIESETANVRVKLLKDAEPVSELEIEQGAETVSLRAGLYEVSIDGPTDGLRLTQRQVRILRGETVVVTVTQTPTRAQEGDNPPPAAEQQQHAAVPIPPQAEPQSARDLTLRDRLRGMRKLPTWDGRRPDEWLRILNNERQPKRRVEAIKAIVGLADDLEPPIAAELLLHAGAATVEDFVANNPDNVSAIVASERALWSDDGTSSEPILDALRGRHFITGMLLAQNLDSVIDELAELPVEALVAASYEAIPQTDLPGEAIFLRTLVRRSMTVEPNSRDSNLARLRLIHAKAVGETFSALEDLVLIALEPTRILELGMYFQSPSFAQNSANAAIALRLARVLPNDLRVEDRMHVLARGIAQNDFGLAKPLYQSRRVRPIGAADELGIACINEIVPVLRAALDRPGFAMSLLESDLGPLDILVMEWSKVNEVAPAGFLDRVLVHLADWRDSAQLALEVDRTRADQRYRELAPRFAATAALLTGLRGTLPEVVTRPVVGSGDLPKAFEKWKTEDPPGMGIAIMGGQDPQRKVLADWYPYHFMRQTLLHGGQDGNPSALPEDIGVTYYDALWLATAASVVGTNVQAEERIAKALHTTVRHGPLAATLRQKFAPIEKTAAIVRLLKRHPGMRMLVREMQGAADSNRLRAGLMMTLAKSPHFNQIRQRELHKLIRDKSHPELSMQAMLWAAEWGLFEDEQTAAIVLEQLAMSRPPDLEFNILSGWNVDTYRLQKLLLLELFSDTQIRPVAEQFALTTLASGEEVPNVIQSALMFPNDRVITSHTLAPELRLISRFPNLAADFDEQLQSLHQRFEERGWFESDHGQMLKEAFETVFAAAGR